MKQIVSGAGSHNLPPNLTNTVPVSEAAATSDESPLRGQRHKHTDYDRDTSPYQKIEHVKLPVAGRDELAQKKNRRHEDDECDV